MKEIQKWKGFVQKINDTTFEAELIDLTNGGTHEYGTFDLSGTFLLSDTPNDISIGSVFTWTISEHNGEHISVMEFPVLKFTEEELKQAERKAEEWIKNLKLKNGE